MKILLKSISIFILASVLLASCASTTLIKSIPPRAVVYINSERSGETPYTYSDKKIAGTPTNITLKKEGYNDFNVTLVRNEKVAGGAIIGGYLFVVPFLWIMKYKPTHTYELVPLPNYPIDTTTTPTVDNTPKTVEGIEWLKLKTLVEEEAMTEDDFTTLKLRILNNEYDYEHSIADQIIKLKNMLDSKVLTPDEYKSEKDKIIYGE